MSSQPWRGCHMGHHCPLSTPTSMGPEPASHVHIAQAKAPWVTQFTVKPLLSALLVCTPLSTSRLCAPDPFHRTQPSTRCYTPGTWDTGWLFHFRACNHPLEGHSSLPNPPDGRRGCPAHFGYKASPGHGCGSEQRSPLSGVSGKASSSMVAKYR